MASLSYLTESGNDEVNKFSLLAPGFNQVYRDGDNTSDMIYYMQPTLDTAQFVPLYRGVGLDISVDIATRYGMNGPGTESR